MLNDLLKNYESEMRLATVEENAIVAERMALNEEREELRKKEEALKMRLYKLDLSSCTRYWINSVINPLAAAIALQCGMDYRIVGPMEIAGTVRIELLPPGKAAMALTIYRRCEENHMELFGILHETHPLYDVVVSVQNSESGTKVVPLPGELDEILALFEQVKCDK